MCVSRRSNTLLYTTRVDNGAKKRENKKLCMFIRFFVVQVNNCGCKICLATHSAHVTVTSYIYTCLVTTSRDIYSPKTKYNRKRKCDVSPFYRSYPLAGLVETFSVACETCFNRPFTTLHVILTFAIDRSNSKWKYFSGVSRVGMMGGGGSKTRKFKWLVKVGSSIVSKP